MANVVGFDESIYRRFTCGECGAIVRYVPNEVKWNGQTDEGTKILGLNCPNCGAWHRVNH